MKVIFAGTPGFAAGYLEALTKSHHEVVAVITQPDKPGKRGKRLLPSAVKQTAEADGLTIIQPERLRREDINAIDCDLMVVVAYGQILKQDVLDYPKLGCMNVHASILPRWRGAAPVQRAILAGDPSTGVTLIQMDAGLDTGDMLAKADVAINPDDTAGDIFEKLGAIGHDLLVHTVDKLASGTLVPEPQDNNHAVYAHKIDKQEALLNWASGAQTIDRTVRAFNPDPIAYNWLDDKRVRVHEGKIIPGRKGRAGMILDVSRDGVLVGCGEDAYMIKRIQLPVGKGSVLTGADVLNGWTDLLCTGNLFTAEAVESS